MLRLIVKQGLRKAPGLGYGCEKMGHIFVDRSNARAARRSIEAAKERITGGTSVIFFAEGRHGKNGRLLPFKSGAFRMAIDLGLPILPLTLVDTWKVHPSGTWEVHPGTVRLIVHEPVDVDGYDRSNLQELVQQVRAVVESGLED